LSLDAKYTYVGQFDGLEINTGINFKKRFELRIPKHRRVEMWQK
jgi:hypothetical protein